MSLRTLLSFSKKPVVPADDSTMTLAGHLIESTLREAAGGSHGFGNHDSLIYQYDSERRRMRCYSSTCGEPGCCHHEYCVV